MWARGTGQAMFAVNVENGVAKLDMSFSLGHPSDLHCQLPQQHVPDVPHPQHCDHDQAGDHGVKKKYRKKSAARRERDRLRAQNFQTARNQQKPEIIFPFTGKLLPVNEAEADHDDQSAAVPAAGPTDSQHPPPRVGQQTAPAVVTPSDVAVSSIAVPVARKTHPCRDYFDASSAKKHLFSSNLPTPQPEPEPVVTRNFKKKEADLWTKLFQ